MSAHTISDKELIEKFLRGELLDNEKLIFNTRKEDQAFLILLEEAVISYQGRLNLKEKLKNIGKELSTEKPKTNQKSLYWISGIAASILLLFSLYFLVNQQVNSSELFDTYFEAYPNAYTTKGTTEDNTLSKKAFDFYDVAKYKSAATAFEEIAKKRALNSSEHFYYGISLLSTDAIEKAKYQFKQVTTMHPLYNEAQWYTSLSLIKQDSLAKAKTILTQTQSIFSTSRKINVKNLLNELPE
ncbi:hypothetical protein [uncultured Kordia sp.]|uniref:hypothetical protein n=1 Tax=uncultured Kordia sp. TaxID=507699 RepID=UPI0026215000|nr:hypothetical protein [uncultured Kordia sp.]